MTVCSQQIIALGGGGFSMEPDNPLLDRYLLQQVRKPSPRICFVGTAGGDSQNYIDRFYAAFRKLDCRPHHLSLFRPPEGDLEAFVREQDIVFVGGGNTRNLLALWREWGLDGILRRAWEDGLVLSGVSAGSICWFEEGLTDSITGTLTRQPALGFLPGSNCPHYDGEPARRSAYHRLIQEGVMAGGYAVDDGAALHFLNGVLHAVVSSRSSARAYRVERQGGQVMEQPVPTQYLGTVKSEHGN